MQTVPSVSYAAVVHRSTHLESFPQFLPRYLDITHNTPQIDFPLPHRPWTTPQTFFPPNFPLQSLTLPSLLERALLLLQRPVGWSSVTQPKPIPPHVLLQLHVDDELRSITSRTLIRSWGTSRCHDPLPVLPLPRPLATLLAITRFHDPQPPLDRLFQDTADRRALNSLPRNPPAGSLRS